jgi:hypothetical protein
MATLVWDKTGERFYQTGVDHGVLYLHDGTVVPWNGLIDIEEGSASELRSFYLDGVKYLESLAPGDFIGKLKAYTYPDEFDSVNGMVAVAPGLTYYEQPSKSFNLSYRTRVGNDLDGNDHAYKIHILYNLLANPEAHSFGTISDSSAQPVEFSWSLTGTPPKPDKYRPTVHISMDSRTTPPDILKLVEDTLYGTATTAPSLPTILEISEYFGYLGALIIVDHGNGTWSAIDEADTYITMLSDTEFQIDDADATYLDPDTYTISSTNVGSG